MNKNNNNSYNIHPMDIANNYNNDLEYPNLLKIAQLINIEHVTDHIIKFTYDVFNIPEEDGQETNNKAPYQYDTDAYGGRSIWLEYYWYSKIWSSEEEEEEEYKITNANVEISGLIEEVLQHIENNKEFEKFTEKWGKNNIDEETDEYNDEGIEWFDGVKKPVCVLTNENGHIKHEANLIEGKAYMQLTLSKYSSNSEGKNGTQLKNGDTLIKFVHGPGDSWTYIPIDRFIDGYLDIEDVWENGYKDIEYGLIGEELESYWLNKTPISYKDIEQIYKNKFEYEESINNWDRITVTIRYKNTNNK